MSESIISTTADLVTLVNVFTCEPQQQQNLVDVLIEATEQVISHQPGFISANIHASLDGTRVTNYAQWASVGQFEQMQSNPQCRPHMGAAAALGTFEPALYRVVSVHHA